MDRMVTLLNSRVSYSIAWKVYSVVRSSRETSHRLPEPPFSCGIKLQIHYEISERYPCNFQNMPTYKLTYFNVTGLGEVIRYLLHQNGIKFEDVRFNLEDWPKHKSTMPMGQVPVLEIDGKVYHQSKAIARFLAKKAKLYGSDDIEAMEIDATVDDIEDLRQALSTYYWEQDPAIKAKLKEVAYQKLPTYLDKLAAQVKKNGGYFVRGKLSLADLLWASYAQYLGAVLEGDPNKDHPELKKLVEKVQALPNIKAYMEKRPKTQL